MIVILVCPHCQEETRIDNGMLRLYCDEWWQATCSQCRGLVRCTFTARKASDPIETGKTA